MDSPYAVVVPVAAKDLGICLRDSTPVSYFLDQEVPVYLAVNGQDAEHTVHQWRTPEGCEGLLHVIFGGADNNPYPARSIGMSLAISAGYEMVVLTDGDCVPHPAYHSLLLEMIDRNKLYAGRVVTRIPDKDTLHFNLLREARFECYDGFRPPNICVGANMVVGANVFHTLGPMRTDRSGGDADYSIRYKRITGHETLAAPNLVVEKTINGMTLLGILQKQILRGFSDPLDAEQTISEVRPLISSAARLLADRVAPSHTLPMTAEEYANVVDSIFNLTYLLGRLARRTDCTPT